MKNKVKLPVWIVVTLIMTACMLISAAVMMYVAEYTIEQTLYSIIMESETQTGRYPDWFTEWQNTVYFKEQMEE